MANAARQRQTSNTFRVLHRYLGFFLVGIMAVYAVSGMVMIFRDTDFLKQEQQVTRQLDAGLSDNAIGQALRLREFKADRTEGDIVYFSTGNYNRATGQAQFKVKELPGFLLKMTQLHKARSADPLFYLNLFFGISLLFFVISAFWMFLPSTPMFKKGMYFTLGGIVLTVILILLK